MSKALITRREKERGRKYTPKQKRFLKELVKTEFKNPREAAKVANVRYWETVQALKEDIKEISEALVLGSAPEAAMVITEMLNPDPDAPMLFSKERLTAAKEVLDRAGITKQDTVNVNHEHGGGIFLLPTKTVVPEEEDILEGEYEHVEGV